MTFTLTLKRSEVSGHAGAIHCWAPGRYIYIHCGHADSHRMGSNDMAVGANTATRQGRSAAGLTWPSQAIFAYESAASARVTRSAKAQRVPATYRCCIKCNVGAADTSRGSWG